ncbi:MAG: hypothetical protein D6743_08275 [Calditrichaeota bacterium]|nr:MAG: hypothetical protein D6743_08275 [Calditrichota bacterium]
MNLQKTCNLIRKYHLYIVLLAVVFAVIGAHYTTKLALQTDLTALLPDSFESVKAYNEIKKKVGGIGELRLVIESEDFDAAVRLANDLAPALRKSPYVKYVDHKNAVDFYEKNALLFLRPEELDTLYARIDRKIAREKQKLNPLLVEDLFGDTTEEEPEESFDQMIERYQELIPKPYYTNPDSSVLVMKVIPSGSNADLSFIRKMFADVKRIVNEIHPTNYAPDIKIYYGGNFKNRLDEYEVIKKDIFGTAAYGLGGVFLLIVLYFRRILGALLISITLLFSLAWTFGLTYWVLGNLNTITGFLFVILFGLGIDYGIHAFARYVESREAGLSMDLAIEKMACTTGKALMTTALTTSLAFFSLMIMDFRGFSDLGFIAGVGILFALIAMVIVLPAFVILLDRIHLLKIEPKPNKTLQFRRREFKYSRPILLASLLLTLLAVYGVSRVQFEYDFTELRAITPERKIVSEKTRGVFKLSESPAVVLTSSDEEIDAVMEAVREKMRSDTLSPTIDAVRSIRSLVPPDQDVRLARIRRIRELVADAEDVLTGKDKQRLEEFKKYLQVDRPYTWDEFPEKDKRQFITRDGEIGKFVFIYPSVPLRDGRNAIAFRNDVGTIRTRDGRVFHASSSNIILADMLIVLSREGRIAIGLTFLVVFLVVLVDLRSLKGALMVLSPLIIGLLWMGGAMYLSGMKLNFFNIVVIPSVIGIGVDNGVHIFHRYREEGPGSLYHVLKNTGLAILVTNLTTLVGYSGLIVARHPGLNSIGKLAIIGLSATFIAAVVVLPALLQWLENRSGATSGLQPGDGPAEAHPVPDGQAAGGRNPISLS